MVDPEDPEYTPTPGDFITPEYPTGEDLTDDTYLPDRTRVGEKSISASFDTPYTSEEPKASSGSSEPTASESMSSHPMEHPKDFNPDNPLGSPIRDVVLDGWEMLGANPGTWISAAALFLIALPALLALYFTFGVLEVVNRFFGHQVNLMRYRVEAPNRSPMQKSGYLLALGILYLLKLPFWLVTLPFKGITWIVDVGKDTVFPDSPASYAWAAFVFGIIGAVAYQIVY